MSPRVNMALPAPMRTMCSDKTGTSFGAMAKKTVPLTPNKKVSLTHWQPTAA